MPYIATNAFNPILAFLANQFSSICSLFTLPEQSHEGRTIQGIRIGKPASSPKRAILLFGGCHARELVNPDLLVTFAADLMSAYTSNNDLVFGSVVYGATTVRLLVDAMDILVVPLINPDGRAYVQSTDPWWRKNRSPNPGETCPGVDINRNYDFLWSSGIGTSASSCSDVYKGSAPFSEPETRNVRWLLDHFAEIEAMVDVHSYSELVLYPWGDDQTQTTDPNMNFTNPAFNGQRGIGGDVYKEYMRPQDRDLFEDAGYRVRDAIHKVRGRCYTVKTAFGLYPTSGTSCDYAYSRHIVDRSKRKVFAYVLETGREFQPPPAEANQIITEVCAGLFQFCIAFCCPIVSRQRHRPDCAAQVTALDLFRDPALLKTRPGRRYQEIISEHFMEVRELLAENRQLYTTVVRLMHYADQVARLHFAGQPGVLDARLIRNLDRALATLGRTHGLSAPLKRSIAAVREDLPHFEGRTLTEGFKLASRAK